MMLTRVEGQMFQHHRQTVRAVVYNQKNGNGISYSSSNAKTAVMSKSGVLDARYSGRVTVVARHTYGSGRYLQASAVVNIKPIWITLKPSTKLITTDSIKTVNGRRSMVISYHSVVNLKASVFTFPSEKVQWSLSNKKRVANVKKYGNTLVITGNSSGDGSIQVTTTYKNVRKTIIIKLQGRTETVPIPNSPTASDGGQKDNFMLNTYFKQNPHLSEREKDIIRAMANLSTGNGGGSKGPIEKALAWIVDTFICDVLSYPLTVAVNMLKFTGNLVEGVGAALAYIAGGGKNEKLYNQAVTALEQLPSSASNVVWNAVEMLLSIGIAKLGIVAFKKLVAGLKKSFPKLSKKIEGLVNTLQQKIKTNKTYPSKKPNSTAKPKGNPAKVPKGANDDTIRGITIENESAEILAQKGFDIEQNPKVLSSYGIDMTKKPDYRIEGEIFDHYAPQKNKTCQGIWSAVKKR